MGLEEKPRSSVTVLHEDAPSTGAGMTPVTNSPSKGTKPIFFIGFSLAFHPLRATPNALTFSCYVRVVFENYPKDHWTLKGLAILRTLPLLYRFFHPSIGGSFRSLGYYITHQLRKLRKNM